jgi:hypothetical protein
MAITLYDATVPGFLQGLRALRRCLDKGQEHARSQGWDLAQLVDARLIDDMFPLDFQVHRVVDHSAGGLRDVSKGAFTMPNQDRRDYAGLQKLLAETEAEVEGWTPAAVNALEGREVVMDTGRSPARTFKADAYLLTFVVPNFFFHAATAYDILRMKGVPIGKADWLVRMRTSF